MESKNAKITFRVTESEKILLQKKADKMKISLSKYCCEAAMNHQIVCIDGLREMLPELNRLGNNINQIAMLMHQRQNDNPGFWKIHQEFNKFVTTTYKIMKGGL